MTMQISEFGLSFSFLLFSLLCILIDLFSSFLSYYVLNIYTFWVCWKLRIFPLIFNTTITRTVSPIYPEGIIGIIVKIFADLASQFSLNLPWSLPDSIQCCWGTYCSPLSTACIKRDIYNEANLITIFLKLKFILP